MMLGYSTTPNDSTNGADQTASVDSSSSGGGSAKGKVTVSVELDGQKCELSADMISVIAQQLGPNGPKSTNAGSKLKLKTTQCPELKIGKNAHILRRTEDFATSIRDLSMWFSAAHPDGAITFERVRKSVSYAFSKWMVREP